MKGLWKHHEGSFTIETRARLQEDIDDAAGEGGGEGVAEAGQEPLRRIQHRQRRVLLQAQAGASQGSYTQ